MPRITLPKQTLDSGETVDHWAELRDVSELRMKDKRAVQLAGDIDGGMNAKVGSIRDTLIAVMVKNWSLDLPVPTVDEHSSLLELNMATYNVLSDAVDSAADAMNPDAEKGDPKDPDSPSEPSTA